MSKLTDKLNKDKPLNGGTDEPTVSDALQLNEPTASPDEPVKGNLGAIMWLFEYERDGKDVQFTSFATRAFLQAVPEYLQVGTIKPMRSLHQIKHNIKDAEQEKVVVEMYERELATRKRLLSEGLNFYHRYFDAQVQDLIDAVAEK